MEMENKIESICDWVQNLATQEFTFQQLADGVANKLCDSGVPLLRLHLTVRIVHPIYSGTAVTWNREGEIDLNSFTPADGQSDDWMQSPLRYMLENGMYEYHHVFDEEGRNEPFPLFNELKGRGGTSYFANITAFGDPETALEREDGFIISWVTNHPGGWSQEELNNLKKLQATMAIAIRWAMTQRLAENILNSYFGKGVGGRLLSGQVRLGDGEDINAIIWFSDLRSSTRLAETMGKDSFLDLLNDFLGCMVTAVEEARGEVLSYIGDSVLAIFPYEIYEDPSDAAEVALNAALLACSNVDALNEQRKARGEAPIQFGIGLHPGVVMFGNIGTRTRLNFSVVGSAVNEAARVTDMCRDLNERLLVTDKFKRMTSREWISKGEYQFRNVKSKMELWVPKYFN